MSSTRQPSETRSAASNLAMPVRYLPHVRPQLAERLSKLGISTVTDLLFYFPRDYRDLTDVRDIANLEEDILVSLLGTVEEIDSRVGQDGRTRLGVLVRQGNDYLRAIWFNQPYMRAKFSHGQHVMLSGKPRFYGGRWQMAHPRVTWLDDEQDDSGAQILPVYPLTEGVGQYQIRRLVQHALDQFAETLPETFPAELLERYNLWPLAAALPQIHCPTDQQSLAKARRRFVFQELYILQLALALRRWQSQRQARAPLLEPSAKIDARILRLFPFELTGAQRRAIDEIAADMSRPCPMNRLLHGEVGSGKTVVALYAMLLCVAHGHQAVLMAPTEVLAQQHAETLAECLKSARVRTALLTGGLSRSARNEVLAAVAEGQIDLVIGTHAVLQDDVHFARLGLVVIDEQHRFGVLQRARLKQSGADPHYLVMTATPIPRTIAMTMFGDLDTSTIRENPPGRQPVQTYLVGPEQTDRWWQFVRKKLGEGRQAFVIAPLVEESDNVALANVEATYEQLANGQFEAFRLGLVHGRLSPSEKQDAMHAFRSGQTQVLVATSIVEVGVDVPNATVITILGAERFGLAQLHQLRGRVSRGKHPGYCAITTESASHDVRQRLQAVVDTTDGFELADIDFAQRGPGDLLGTRQHGLPPLRIADLRVDQPLLEEARQAARELIEVDPGLAHPDHERLRRMVLVRYGQALELGDVG